MTAKKGTPETASSPPLDARKAFILATIVYEYVASAEPVGSNTLTQKYRLGVSSATIRNEMAELEAAGYLVQPHTSAGRIPSDSGYRTYVDHLMRPEALAPEESRRIGDELRAASRELEEAVEAATRVLGQLSHNLAFVVEPPRDAQVFRHVQLVWLSEHSGLAIVVAPLGVVAQQSFDHEASVGPEELARLSNLLNARFDGKPLRELAAVETLPIVRELALPDALAEVVASAFAAAAGADLPPAVVASGTQHLLDQPEFQDLRKLRGILRIIEEQQALYDLVADAIADSGPSAKIGRELGSEEIGECSIVTVPYRLAERGVGVLAILGPRRMPYARLFALAAGTAASLDAHLAARQG
ncbi:MAG: heat-inducible transcriptional repressor HrcA [Vulcanimicrobiaceae bacterium]